MVAARSLLHGARVVRFASGGSPAPRPAAAPERVGPETSFYTLVACDTVNQDFVQNLQRFLAEQGYSYTIVDAPTIDGALGTSATAPEHDRR